jgi:hypothetical protein
VVVFGDRWSLLVLRDIVFGDPLSPRAAGRLGRGDRLVPVFAQLGSWGLRHRPTSRALGVRAELLEHGGPALWQEFMDEPRREHLGAESPCWAVGRPSAVAAPPVRAPASSPAL